MLVEVSSFWLILMRVLCGNPTVGHATVYELSAGISKTGPVSIGEPGFRLRATEAARMFDLY